MSIGPYCAYASDFDECVVAHMKDAIADFAAKAIKASCVRLTEKDLPEIAKLSLEPDSKS
jgi:hypothetical protein